MRKRLLWVVPAFVLLLPGLWLVADWLVNRPASRVNYERIRVGRPLQEAEDRLGEPSRNDRDERYWCVVQSRVNALHPIDAVRQPNKGKLVWHYWSSGRYTIGVHVDPAGTVVHKYYLCAVDTWPLSISLQWLPLWITALTSTGGLLIIVYLGLTWQKKARPPAPVLTPTVTRPTTVSQNTAIIGQPHNLKR